MKILEIKDLRKSFGKTEVLKGVSFSMEKGQVLSIIGSSGSGKTTLLRSINFLEDADCGEIYVDGKCIYDGSLSKKLTASQEYTRGQRVLLPHLLRLHNWYLYW